MSTTYVYEKGEKDYPVTFAGLTKRDGSFIVSRKEIENFKLDDLKGSHIIAGRRAGMPVMIFEYALRKNNIDPKKELFVDTSIAYAGMSGAFIGGIGDFVTLFEPNALSLVKNGFGHNVAYLGSFSDDVPYTVYNAKKSYIKKNPDIIKEFSTAINKGLDYVNTHSEKDIAKVILPYFPDTSLNDLEKIILEYKNGDAWRNNINISEEEWEHLQDIIISYGEFDRRVPYDELIYTKYFTYE